MKTDPYNSIGKKLRLRILEIIHRAHTYHIGSCICSLDLIYGIYNVKKQKDKFVLSNGHAAVAWYAVLEHAGLLHDPSLANLHVHPDRNPAIGIEASSGSLGQGLPIAVGMALSDRRKRVYCMVSDGECNEGSIWESLRVAVEQKLDNLTVIVNANGWGSYGRISTTLLIKRLRGFVGALTVIDGHNIKKITKALTKKRKNKPLCILARTHAGHIPFLKGQDALYHVMTDNEFRWVKKNL